MRSRVLSASRLWRTLPLWIGAGIAVTFVVGLAGDLPRVVSAVQRFHPEWVPLILGLTFLNYVLRFIKWGYYLRLIGAPTIPLHESAAVFFAGLAMTITPGKVGEWLKSYLLLRRYGVPIATSAPIILAERLTDGLAMVLLALGGPLAYGLGGEILGTVVAGAGLLIVGVRARRLVERVLGVLARAPVIGGSIAHLHAFYASSRRLLDLGPLALATTIGFVSWSGECVAFFLVLVGLGIDPTLDLLLKATFVLAVATLIGSLSMVPGGLAIADGSIAGLLLLLGITDDPALAVAATLLIRVATLWFGVAVGLVALALVGRAAESSGEV